MRRKNCKKYNKCKRRENDYYSRRRRSIWKSNCKLSINAYGWYYIGRYEAGAVNTDGTSLSALRSGYTNDTNNPDKKVAIRANEAPYNWVTRDGAKDLVEGSAGIVATYGYTNVTAHLCSSYAWDTAIKYIEQNASGASNYSTSSTQGNYSDTSFVSGSALIRTGQTTSVCKIYDMGGNVWEWTTEALSHASHPCVTRGGDYPADTQTYPAGYRNLGSTSNSSAGIGFRPTLFLEP